MAEFDPSDLLRKIRNIDPSDVRALVVGLVVLVIPIIFLLTRAYSPKDGFAVGELRDGGRGGRGGFSFVQQQETAPATRAPSACLFRSPRAANEWQSAVDAIARAPLELPVVEGMSAEARQLFEADLDPQLRRANAYLNSGRLPQALQEYLAVLARNSNNPFLNFYASAALCTVYERMGRTEDLAREFRRMIALMARLPHMGFKAELMKGLRYLAMIGPLMDQVQADPATRQFVQQLLSERGLSGKLTIDAFMEKAPRALFGHPNLTPDLLPQAATSTSRR